MRKEIDSDRLYEELQEHQQEAYQQWLSDNKDTLLKEFVQDFYESEFDEFCRQEWLKDGEK